MDLQSSTKMTQAGKCQWDLIKKVQLATPYKQSSIPSPTIYDHESAPVTPVHRAA